MSHETWPPSCTRAQADWGYNTAAEREAAAGVEGVRVIGLKGFCELLRFGLIMEVRVVATCDPIVRAPLGASLMRTRGVPLLATPQVTDGCEPTAEEVAAGVAGAQDEW